MHNRANDCHYDSPEHGSGEKYRQEFKDCYTGEADSPRCETFNGTVIEADEENADDESCNFSAPGRGLGHMHMQPRPPQNDFDEDESWNFSASWNFFASSNFFA